MDIVWTVGDVIRKFRKAQGLSQADLARLAKLDVGTVNRIELEEDGNVKMRSIVAVAAALGVTLPYLYSLIPPPVSIPDEKIAVLSERAVLQLESNARVAKAKREKKTKRTQRP